VEDILNRARHFQGLADIVLEEHKVGMTLEMGEVLRLARNEVINADDLMTVRHQPVAQMRADEACSPGDEDSHLHSPLN